MEEGFENELSEVVDPWRDVTLYHWPYLLPGVDSCCDLTLYCIFLEDFVKGKHRCYRAKILSEIIQRSERTTWEKLKKLEKNKTILMTAVSEKLYYIRVNEEMIKNYEKEIELDNKKMNEALMALE